MYNSWDVLRWYGGIDFVTSEAVSSYPDILSYNQDIRSYYLQLFSDIILMCPHGCHFKVYHISLLLKMVGQIVNALLSF